MEEGKAALEDELFDLAQKKFEKAIRKSRSHEEKATSNLFLMQTLFGKGFYQAVLDGVKEWEETLNDHELSCGYRFWKAQALFRLDQKAVAAALLDTMLTECASTDWLASATRLRARVHLASGEPKAALPYFALFVEQFPSSSEGSKNYLDWASALVQMNRYEEAQAVLS